MKTISSELGLYVHVPFCEQKCSYCDFCSFPGVCESDRAKYIAALLKEIRSYKSATRYDLTTVFFGGGTPSLLTVPELENIMNAIRDSFSISPDAEITIEANPGTVTMDKLLSYKKLGINRISFGMQSIHENELKILGRIHNYEEFEKAYFMARDAGFDNINVDLMYGIPEQTMGSFSKTLERVMSLLPEHISAYSLIIEEGTPIWEKRFKLLFPTEDEERDMYDTLVSRLTDNGYVHYEISNYSKPGYQSRHNLIYWHTDDYIGVGLAAHSYFDGVRFSNSLSLDEYVANPLERIEQQRVSTDEQAYEYPMLHLRLKDGFALSDYRVRFGRDFTEENFDKLKKYEDSGFLKLKDGRIFLTDDGMYVSNAILVDLL